MNNKNNKNEYDYYENYDDNAGKGFLIIGGCILGMIFLILSVMCILTEGDLLPLIITSVYILGICGYIYYQKKNSKLSDDFVPSGKSKDDILNEYAAIHQAKELREKQLEQRQEEARIYLVNAQAREALNKPKCPTCGSTRVEKISATKRWVSTGVFGLASSNIGKIMCCKNCGYKW